MPTAIVGTTDQQTPNHWFIDALKTPILEIRNAGYHAGGKAILNDVSWLIQRGEHWVILGSNGAGKTTLLKLACGYVWPNLGGEVLRLGQTSLDLRALRQSIGWVSFRLASEIPKYEKVLDTVVSGRVAQIGLKVSLHGLRPQTADYEAAEQHLQSLGCTELICRPFGVLSQGEQQKVLIARALMARPLIVFLDEPCAGLDPGAREHLLHSLEELASNGNSPSLILVTHHIEEIMPSFGRILAMSNSRIVAQGTTQELITAGLLESLYTRPVKEIVRRDGRTWPIF